MTAEILIELDERRRASLGRIARPEHRRYLAETRDDGTIIMRPVDVVPAVVGSPPAQLAPAFVPPPRPRRHPDLDAREGVQRLRDQLTRGGRRPVEP